MTSTPFPFRRVAILGVGLIGGSLGLAWKRAEVPPEVIGFDRPDVLDEAIRLGAIDSGASSAEAAVTHADLVVLAAPIEANLHLLEVIATAVQPGTVLTDVGSVKQPMARRAAEILPPTLRFVGGHPMAGSEHSGVAYADPSLFENATYALCADTDAAAQALPSEAPELLTAIQHLGAAVVLMDAARHDRVAAAVSHVPQLLAVALMNFVARQHATDDTFLTLAAGGFRDMTRIASSPFRMWHDILRTNRASILEMLDHLSGEVDRLRAFLDTSTFKGLHNAFQQARTARETIPTSSKGFLNPLSDVYVYIEDTPGALFGIVETLHVRGHDIKDMELLKMREGTGGTFRLGFASPGEAESALADLRSAAFTAFRL